MATLRTVRELALALPEVEEGYPVVLVRLRQATRPVLRERLETAWRMRAPKRLVAGYQAR